MPKRTPSKIQDNRKPVDVDINDLKPHPYNAEVYGKVELDEKFLKDTKQGIVEPIVITAENVIVSGHRRYAACVEHGFNVVACVLRTDLVADSHRCRYDLLLANSHRVKTNEQLVNEAKALADTRKALFPAAKPGPKKAPNNSGLKPTHNTPGQQEPPEPTQNANIVATAQALGIGTSKTKQSIAIAEEIARLDSIGSHKRADEIKDMLNAGSVSATYNAVIKKPNSPKPKKAKSRILSKPFSKVDAIMGQLSRGVDALAELLGGQGVHYAKVDDLLDDVYKAIEDWKSDEG